MTAAVDLELMRASTLLETDPAAALRCAGAVLSDQPAHEGAGLLLAAACRRLGDAAGAAAVLEPLAKALPQSALIQLELGRAYAACGRGADAAAVLTRAVYLDAALADAWCLLASQLFQAGDLAAADSAYLKYRRLAADPADLAPAYAAFDQDHLDAAEELVRQRLQAGTNEVAALTLLAAIAWRRGDELTEESTLARVLLLAPCDGAAREQLSRLLIRQGRIVQALPLIERLLEVEPERSALRVLKAEALRLADRHSEGLAILAALAAEHPGDPDFWLLLGNQHRYLGDTHEATVAYRRAIEVQPGYSAAYLALANLKSTRFSAEDIDDMQRQLETAPPLGQDGTNLEFALGQALEAEGRFADSFSHYARANRRARDTFRYDPKATTAFVQRFKATFTKDFFDERRDWGNPTVEPIFIVGLPRSGSTLLEQILASHSAVEGTRELPYVPTMARELAGPPATAASYPAGLASLRKSDVESLGSRYLASAQAHRAPGKPRFIDKMHGNFASLGLIHLMFPRAIIIDSRRHPLACGFACYRQYFVAGMNFAYDLGELGLYYRDYADLMRHIDAVLPGRVHRVQYERLVADTEREVSRLLSHCGLPFEPGCLRFHENRRIVLTLSAEQVRRPIYSDSVEQWRNYEPWLDPLRAVLGSWSEP